VRRVVPGVMIAWVTIVARLVMLVTVACSKPPVRALFFHEKQAMLPLNIATSTRASWRAVPWLFRPNPAESEQRVAVPCNASPGLLTTASQVR
jgi:hypothetical protein